MQRCRALNVAQDPHSEQRPGFRPQALVNDDGHVVDESALSSLIESGALCVIRRPPDYHERRTDGYLEPVVVYVLGTSHVSESSAADVERVILAVRPQSVAVELCKSRVGLMQEDPQPTAGEQEGGKPQPAAASSLLGLSGGSLPEALQRSLRLGGQGPLLLRAALARTASSVGEAASVRPGLDFRAASRAAEQVGAEIILGDRPLEITLKRAWAALTAWQRLKLMGGLASVILGIGGSQSAGAKQLVQQVSSEELDDDVVDGMMARVAQEYPALLAPLVAERDAYLAWSMKRSRAVCGKRRVVGVVGRGHLAGVVRQLETDNGGDQLVFKQLVDTGDAKSSESQRALQLTLRITLETLAGVAAWAAWQTIWPSS